MSDILSQSEIDNLLKQLSDGDLDVDQIPVSYTHLTLPTIYSV